MRTMAWNIVLVKNKRTIIKLISNFFLQQKLLKVFRAFYSAIN